VTLRRAGWALTAILAAALIARVLVVLLSPHFVPKADAWDYDRIAVALAQHGTYPGSILAKGPTAFRPPVFPIVLAGLYKVVGVGSASTRWEAARLLEAVLGTITVALVFLIARRVWDRTVALVSAAVAAVYPPLLLAGASLLAESVCIPLLLGGVLAALEYRRTPNRLRWALIAGVLVGLAALARVNVVLVAVPVALLVWSERPRLAWRSLRAPLAVALATVAVLTPWTIRSSLVMHRFVPVSDETGYALVGTYNSYAQARTDYPALWLPPIQAWRGMARIAHRLNEAQISERMTTLAVDYAKAHPAYVGKVAIWNSLRLANFTGPGVERWIEQTWGDPASLAVASVYAFWALAALALLGGLTAAGRRAPPARWGCPLAVCISTVLIIGATRYRLPADPFIIMFASVGLLAVWRRIAVLSTRWPWLRNRLPSPAA
jgi:hypothetical protein